jgi:hypothetical protein
MSKRKDHGAAFKACVALDALKRGRLVSDLPTAHQVQPKMIHQAKKMLLASAVG